MNPIESGGENPRKICLPLWNDVYPPIGCNCPLGNFPDLHDSICRKLHHDWACQRDQYDDTTHIHADVGQDTPRTSTGSI